MLSFQGHRVIRQNHIGDWGTQFGRVMLGLFAFLILAVIVTPAEWLAAGMKCPYL